MATPKAEILARIAAMSPGTLAGSEEESEASPPVDRKSEILARIAALDSNPIGFTSPPERDVGFARALATGVRNGFVAPFTIFGAEQRELDLDETSEKIASTLGELVGYGIGFIPFGLVPAGGAIRAGGYAMRGIGFTEPILNPAVREFVKYTLGGAIQQSGAAEELEEVPKEFAKGAVYGALIDGFFLARAMRNRPRPSKALVRLEDTPQAQATGFPKGPPDTPDPPTMRAWRVEREDEVYPIAALPGTRRALPPAGGTIERADNLRKEIRLFPSANKQPLEISATIQGLADNRSLDSVLTDLVETDLTQSLLLEGIQPSSTKEVIREIKRRAPNAQILSRNIIKGEIDEVFVHNPTDIESHLRPDQIARWLEGNPIPGQEALYRGTIYKATGNTLPERGFVQLKSLDNRITFAARREEIHFPLTPTLFDNFSPKTPTFNQMALRLSQGLDEIGFTVRSTEAALMSVRRGTVNTEGFLEYKHFDEFMKDHGDAIARIEARSLQEATEAYAKSRGIPGIREVEAGITKKITVFDQSRVKFISEPPRIGVDLDQSLTRISAEGRQELLSFEPSWKNSIVGPLRASGFAEKDIQAFIEQRAVSDMRKIESIMDDEFKDAFNASRAQFLDGCL